MGVARSSCYKLLTAKMALINVRTIGIALSCFESESTGREYQDWNAFHDILLKSLGSQLLSYQLQLRFSNHFVLHDVWVYQRSHCQVKHLYTLSLSSPLKLGTSMYHQDTTKRNCGFCQKYTCYNLSHNRLLWVFGMGVYGVYNFIINNPPSLLPPLHNSVKLIIMSHTFSEYHTQNSVLTL